ncbi:MAG: acyl-CoA dehydrogenase family protein [Deltaproteobacteria bacterium]|nr:acyl-CoA dehydrogenase family protein [Deltaproteobacteria bacterium]
MDFRFTATQEELYERVLTFARRELNEGLAERERARVFPRAAWLRAGELGLAGLCIPEAYGGMGLDALSSARLVEALGKGCEDGGLVFGLAAHLFACAEPICRYAQEDLRRRVVPGLASGRLIGANAATEAEAGSDIHAIACRAERVGDDYVLTGEKSYVTNGPVADVFLVYASTNPRHGYLGLSAFVVERGAEGLEVGRPFDTLGLVSAPLGPVYLRECRVPAAQRLGEEGQGSVIFAGSMRWERACLFAGYVGMLERQLESTTRYAQERTQRGKPIGAHQAIAHRLVEMKVRLEAARLLLYRACWLIDQGEDATEAVAMAKLAVSEAAVQSSLDAVQVHGASGVIRDVGVERMLRDALPSTIVSGTSEIQRNIIASLMGL